MLEILVVLICHCEVVSFCHDGQIHHTYPMLFCRNTGEACLCHHGGLIFHTYAMFEILVVVMCHCEVV